MAQIGAFIAEAQPQHWGGAARTARENQFSQTLALKSAGLDFKDEARQMADDQRFQAELGVMLAEASPAVCVTAAEVIEQYARDSGDAR